MTFWARISSDRNFIENEAFANEVAELYPDLFSRGIFEITFRQSHEIFAFWIPSEIIRRMAQKEIERALENGQIYALNGPNFDQNQKDETLLEL